MNSRQPSNNRNVVVVAPAESYPITLEEARLQCKVDAYDGSPPTHPDDTRLESLIAAATQELDGPTGWLGRCLITQTLELILDCFPREDCGKIKLPFPPLQQVVSVEYIDSDGVEQTLDPPSGSPATGGDYRLVSDMEPPYIEPVYGTTWPATRGSAAVRIQYVAGYGNAEDVPNQIKEYMMHIIALRYEYREAASMGMVVKNPYIEYMLNSFRIW
jgi:uncharacterized phiE125 gp8 family phage protein